MDNQIAFMESICCFKIMASFMKIGKYDNDLFQILEFNVLKHLDSISFQNSLEMQI